MIGKIGRGADGGGLVRYLFGAGRAEEHTGQRVVAAADMLEVPVGVALSEGEAKFLGQQLDAAQRGFGTEVQGGHIWHLCLSNPASDRQLSDAEWAGVVRDAMARVGFTEESGKAPCRWVAVRHGLSSAGNDHVHVAVSLVRDDGTKASIWRDRVRMSEVCAGAERALGLTVVEGRSHGRAPQCGPGRGRGCRTAGPP